MEILLAFATEHEIDLPKINFIRNKTGNKIDLLITGVGVASAIYHLTKKILQTKYDIVIQAGIGGTFNDNVLPGEVAFVKADTFADCGVEEKGIFKTLFNYGLTGENDFPFENGWLVNKTPFLKTDFLKTVTAITVNKITDNKEQIIQQKNFFKADVESMEGAALHYVCLQSGVSFLQIRSISNRVGERDKSKWNLEEAVSNLNKQLERLLEFDHPLV